MARARALAGVRFRPQGRSPAGGLDCIALPAAAAGLDPAMVRRDYGLRGGTPVELERELSRFGFVAADEDAAAPGDLLVCAPGAAQLHLAIFTGSGIVHADAALRRVVERPLPVPWPVLGAWRPAQG